MEYKGSSAYDEEPFFQQYISRRTRHNSPNNLIESPIFMKLLDEVNEKVVLDLGCGDGSFGLELLNLGCKLYVGVDGSENMFKLARVKLKGTNHKLHHCNLETFDYPVNQFDIVTSRLVLHYIEDLEHVLGKVYQSLKIGGQFIMSVQHPILTSSSKSTEQGEKRTDWVVDDYFISGRRVEPWIGEKVVKYHRTIEEYFTTLQKAGFIIENLHEGAPDRRFFDSQEEYNRRKRIPLFLIVKCRKG
ncbi:class I SAM-dependent methyltransferase [Bacillus sp. 31A1R]|uniref:Class I SAM-dependent methyltransferase n=1 Tax=Robertmurraya mangrovi TaxID=3098077 RepID=A0ABU5IWV6_9BACI|nr:class I SAM-dependent methyltransferase [Bacillus sp. 31A1R]MDZ5471638.1 class I SAM-dependent methyltransferase [Bacillus sp. 31A1R]